MSNFCAVQRIPEFNAEDQMFRRPQVVLVNQPTRTEYVTREVHARRAPTDDSVKLLREMEGAAREEIIKAVHVGNTTFECVVHQMAHYEDGSKTLRAVYSINGKKMTTDVREHNIDTMAELAVKLRDKMAEEIATEVLLPALRGLHG